jgi:hypothetical protein
MIPEPTSTAPANAKSLTVQFTSSVNCIATSGVSNRIAVMVIQAAVSQPFPRHLLTLVSVAICSPPHVLEAPSLRKWAVSGMSKS